MLLSDMLSETKVIGKLVEAGSVDQCNNGLVQVLETLMGLREESQEFKAFDLQDELYLNHLKRGFHSDFQTCIMDRLFQKATHKIQIKNILHMEILANLLDYYLQKIVVIPEQEVEYDDVRYLLNMSMMLYCNRDGTDRDETASKQSLGDINQIESDLGTPKSCNCIDQMSRYSIYLYEYLSKNSIFQTNLIWIQFIEKRVQSDFQEYLENDKLKQ